MSPTSYQTAPPRVVIITTALQCGQTSPADFGGCCSSFPTVDHNLVTQSIAFLNREIVLQANDGRHSVLPPRSLVDGASSGCRLTLSACGVRIPPRVLSDRWPLCRFVLPGFFRLCRSGN